MSAEHRKRYFELGPRLRVGFIKLGTKTVRELDPNAQYEWERSVVLKEDRWGAETSTTKAELLADGSFMILESEHDLRYDSYFGPQKIREVVPPEAVKTHPLLKNKVRVA